MIILDAMMPYYMKAYLMVLGYPNVYHLRDICPVDVDDTEVRRIVESKRAILVTRDRKHFNCLKEGRVLILSREDPYWMFREVLEGLSFMGLPPRLEWLNNPGKPSAKT